MKHVLMKLTDEHHCPGRQDPPRQCWLCDGGLAACKVCGMVEVQLDDNPNCPGSPEKKKPLRFGSRS